MAATYALSPAVPAAPAAASALTTSLRRLHPRRRGAVSPGLRASLLAGVFVVWIALSSFLGWEAKDLEDVPLNAPAGRQLLNIDYDSVDMSAFDPKPKNTTMVEASPDEEVLKPGECLRPAVEQFPEPLMGKRARRYGGLIIHIVTAVYMFAGLAIICDNYFVPALDKISEALNLDPDVAGATFMAAGSSGPELATSVIGVFVAKDDIGVSGVIGSAVFNITLVIAVCSLTAKQVLTLNWWSVVRDCTCYLISILVLLLTIANEIVSWPEATGFLILYVIYCVSMAFNSKIEAFVKARLKVPESWEAAAAGASATREANAKQQSEYAGIEGRNQPAVNGAKSASGVEMGMTDVAMTPLASQPPMPQPHAVEALEDPLEKPMDGNRIKLAQWAILYPLYFMAKWTIPDCRLERTSRFFVATFLLAIIWISMYSYMMVWMITVIGFTLGIPDTVMGLTFIAAGVSVPDALGGVAVVREGHGDMAVSNAIGSNVFDILVCLGLPWFLDTTIVNPGKYVYVRSKGLVYSTFSLFSTVIFLITASHINGWKLDKKFGIVLLVWYFVFIIFASLYELNIFGDFNPPECDSNY